MMYLVIFIWLILAIFSIEFKILEQIIFYKFYIAVVPKITDVRSRSSSRAATFMLSIGFILLFCYLIFCGVEVYYLCSHFPSWLLSKTSNKLVLILILNVLILIGLFWMFRVTHDAKNHLKMVIELHNKADWFKNNQQHRKLIFKVIRQMQINSKLDFDSITKVLVRMTIENGWVKYSNYEFLLDNNIIKIKDEDGNMKGFKSFKQFKEFKEFYV